MPHAAHYFNQQDEAECIQSESEDHSSICGKMSSFKIMVEWNVVDWILLKSEWVSVLFSHDTGQTVDMWPRGYTSLKQPTSTGINRIWTRNW